MSRFRILNSDKEVTAVKFNMKEQRCLQKNLVTLDAEASYSVKLIDMENRGMKVFYKRFRDKVLKIRSHLKVNEISNLRDLEATGRLSPPHNTVNTTAALRIADAEKRLKIKGREHLRKTKSAFTSRSLRTSKDDPMQSILNGSYNSHLSASTESVTRPQSLNTALDSKIKGSRESVVSLRLGRDSVEKPKLERTKSNEMAQKPKLLEKNKETVVKHIQKINMLPDLENLETCTAVPKCTGINIVYGEPDPVSAKTDENKAELYQEKICDKQVMKLSNNFIETGNLSSPRIINKITSMNKIQDEPEIDEHIVDKKPTKVGEIQNKDILCADRKETENYSRRMSGAETELDLMQSKSDEQTNDNICKQGPTYAEKMKQNSSTDSNPENEQKTNSRKFEQQLTQDVQINIQRPNSPQKRVCIQNGLNHSNTGTDSPRSAKTYNRLAVPRASQSKSASFKADKRGRTGEKSSNSCPERRSVSAAAGKSSNTSNMNRKYSCHNYDKDAVKMESLKAPFNFQDGLFCFGDDPYEERRQLMITDEHNRFVILLHRKEEYLKRIEEYIRQQMMERTYSVKDTGKKKLQKSPSEIWNELKKTRYLRTGEEHIDLSTVVTLASEQLKSQKAGLKYKPLFQRQKSKKAEDVDTSQIGENMNTSQEHIPLSTTETIQVAFENMSPP